MGLFTVGLGSTVIIAGIWWWLIQLSNYTPKARREDEYFKKWQVESDKELARLKEFHAVQEQSTDEVPVCSTPSNSSAMEQRASESEHQNFT